MIAHLALLLLTVCAFVALCGGLPRYQAGLLGRKITPRRARTLRIAGWLLLAAALVLALSAFGFGRALVLLAAYSMIGGMFTVLMARRHA